MVEAVGLDEFGYVAADQPDLAALDPAVGLGQRDLAVAQALHLAPDQDDAAFQRIDDREIVPRLAVLGDQPLVGVLLRGALLLLFPGRG